MIPFANFKSSKITTPKKIILTFSGTPSTINIERCFYKYNKEIVLCPRFDDGYLDAYQTAFKLFNGGDVIHEDGVELDYLGLYITDGCGNDIPFKGELAINSGTINLNPNPASIMNYNMVSEIYTSDWGLWNTGQNDFGGGTDFEDLVDDAARYQKALDEINFGAEEIKLNTSIKTVNWTAPFNNDFYDGPSYSLFLNGKLKIVNNIDGILNTDLLGNGANEVLSTNRSWEDWLLNPYIGVRYDFKAAEDNRITRQPNVDTNFINDELLKFNPLTYHPIVAIGTHRVNLSETSNGATPGGSIEPNLSNIFAQCRFLSFKHFFEEVESRWGKNGLDNIWVTPLDMVYNYSKTRENVILNPIINGNSIEISCDFSNVNGEYREHSLSLIIENDLNISGITYQGFDETSHNIGYSGSSNNVVLINVSYKPPYEKAIIQRVTANTLVSKAENTQQSSDFDEAQNFINGLVNGSFKDSLQSRLDVIVIIPDSLIFQVDFGRTISGYILPFPWNTFGDNTTGLIAGSKLNNLSSTSGTISGIDIEIINPFLQYDSNFPSDPGDLQFPYEASRDCFTVNNSEVAKLRVSELDESKLYDFLFFSSRGFVGNVTEFTINGTTVSIPHKSNLYTTTEILNVSPSVGGIIDIDVNGDGSNKGYLNVLQITEKNP